MSKDEWVVLTIIVWLVKALNYLLCSWAILPFLAIYSSQKASCFAETGALAFPKQRRDGNTLLTYLLVGWIPRFFMSLLICGLIAMQVGGSTFVVAQLFPDLTTAYYAILISGQILVFLWGFYFIPKLGLCTCFGSLDLKLAFHDVMYSFLDMLTFWLTLLACVLVIRIQQICQIGSQKDEPWKGYRRYVLRQIYMSFVDWALVPFACTLFWRWCLTYKLWTEEKSPAKKRLALLVQWLKMIVDLPCLCLAICMSPLFWRSWLVYFDWWALIRSSGDADSLEESFEQMRITVVMQAFLALLDLPCIALWVIFCVPTCYRIENTKRRYREESNGFFDREHLLFKRGVLTKEPRPHTRRFAAHLILIDEACQVVFDLPFFVLAALLYATIWRTSYVHSILYPAPPTPKPSFSEKRQFVCTQFLQLLIDIPFMFMSLLLGLSVYRGYACWLDIQQLPQPHDPNERRAIICNHVIQLVIDLPYMLLFLLISLTLFRLVWLVPALRAETTATGRRALVLRTFCSWLLDFPALIFLVLVTCSLYRACSMWSALFRKDELRSAHTIIWDSALNLMLDLPFLPFGFLSICSVVGACRLVDRLWREKSDWGRRWICAIEFWLSLLDLCMLGVVLFTVLLSVSSCGFRTYWLSRDLWKEKGYIQSKHRSIIWQHFGMALLDLPALFMSVFLVVTVYRIGPANLEYQERRKRDAAPFLLHMVICVHFVNLCLDIPFILMGLLVFLTCWNASNLWSVLNNKNSELGERRNSAATELLYLLWDLVLFVPFLFVMCLWRRGIYQFIVGDDKTTRSGKRSLLMHQFAMLFFDLPCMLMLVVIAVSLWRLFPLMHQIKAFTSSMKSQSSPSQDGVNGSQDNVKHVEVSQDGVNGSQDNVKHVEISSASALPSGPIPSAPVPDEFSHGLGMDPDTPASEFAVPGGLDEKTPSSEFLAPSRQLERRTSEKDIEPEVQKGERIIFGVPYQDFVDVVGLSCKLHTLVFLNFLSLIPQLPIAVMCLICLLSCWRHAPVKALLTREYTGFFDWGSGSRNMGVCYHCLLLVLDLPVVVIFVGLMFTWRHRRVRNLLTDLDKAPAADISAPPLESEALIQDVKEMKELDEMDSKEEAVVQARVDVPTGRYHEVVLRNLLYLVLDIPSAMAAVIVAASVIRIPLLIGILNLKRFPLVPNGGCVWPHRDWKEFIQREEDRDWYLRALIFRQLWLVFVDVAVLVASVILLCCAPWRISNLYAAWKNRTYTVKEVEPEVLEDALPPSLSTFDPGYCRCDPPRAFVLRVVSNVGSRHYGRSYFRCSREGNHAQVRCKLWGWVPGSEAKPPPVNPDWADFSRPMRNRRETTSRVSRAFEVEQYQADVAGELLEFFKDIPFLFMSIVLVVPFWRLGSLIRELCTKHNVLTASDRRNLVFFNLKEAVIDLPYVLAGLVPFVAFFTCVGYEMQERGWVSNTSWLEFGFLIAGALPYRGVLLLRDLSCRSWNGKSGYNLDATTRRTLAYQAFLMYFVDLFAVIAMTLLAVTGYRVNRMIGIITSPPVTNKQDDIPLDCASAPVEGDTEGDSLIPVNDAPPTDERQKETKAETVEHMDNATRNRVVAGFSRNLSTPLLSDNDDEDKQQDKEEDRHPVATQSIDSRDVVSATDRLHRHFLVIREAFQIPIDLPFAILAVCVCATLWRFPTFKASWQKEIADDTDNPKWEWNRRLLCLSHFFNLLLDLPFLLLLALVWCSIYRICSSYEELKVHIAEELAGKKHVNNRRFVILCQSCNLLLDLPYLVMGGICVMTGYRGIALVLDLTYPVRKHGAGQQHWNAHKRRHAAAKQFLMLFMDILALACFPFVVLTGYRLPHVIRALRHPATVGFFNRFILYTGADEVDWETNRVESQLLVCVEFINILNDIPFLVLFVLMFGTLWRAPGLSYRLWQRADLSSWCSCSETALRFLAWKQNVKAKFSHKNNEGSSLDQVSSDVLKNHLAPYLDAKSLVAYSTTSQRHYSVQDSNKLWKNLFETDFPTKTPGMGAYIGNPLLSVARLGELSDDSGIWKKTYIREYLTRTSNIPREGVQFEGWYLHGFRLVIWKEFLVWLLDIPYLILGVLGLFSGLRTISVTLDVLNLKPSWTTFLQDRHWSLGLRGAFLANFYQIFLDLVAIPCWGLHVLTYYRLASLRTQIGTRLGHAYTLFNPADPKQAFLSYFDVFSSTGHLILDIPFNLMLCLTFYRSVNVFRQMETENKTFGQSEHRCIVVTQLAQLFLDIPFIIMFTCSIPFRAFVCINDLGAIKAAEECGWTEIPSATVRKEILKNFCLIPTDIIGGAFFIFIVFSWRNPTMFCMLKRGRGFKKGVAACLWLLCKDIFAIVVLFPVILLGIQRIPAFFSSVCSLIGKWRSMGTAEEYAAKVAHLERLTQKAHLLDPALEEKDTKLKNTKDDEVSQEERTDRLFRMALHSLRTQDGFGMYNKKYKSDDYRWFQVGGSARPPDLLKPWSDQPDQEQGLSKEKEQGLSKEQPVTEESKAEEKTAEKATEDVPMSSTDSKTPKKAKKLDLNNMMGTKDPSKKRKMINTDYPWSLSFLRQLMIDEARKSVMGFHHILLFPIRCLGFLLFPVYNYVHHRMNDDDEADEKDEDDQPLFYTKSFTFQAVVWLFKQSPPASTHNFNKFELFFVTNLLAIIPLVINELAALVAILLDCVMYLSVFGMTDQEWELDDDLRELSYARSFCCYLSFLVQFLLLPLFVGITLGTSLIPLLLAFLLDDWSWYIYPSLIACLFTGAALFQLQQLFARNSCKLFRPYLFIWVTLLNPIWKAIKGEGILWAAYCTILAHGTHFLWRLKKCSCLFVLPAELLLFALVLSWAGWFNIFVLLSEEYIWFALTGPVSFLFLIRALFPWEDNIVTQNSQRERKTPFDLFREKRAERKQRKLKRREEDNLKEIARQEKLIQATERATKAVEATPQKLAAKKETHESKVDSMPVADAAQPEAAQPSHIACPQCTFVNVGRNISSCEICGSSLVGVRPASPTDTSTEWDCSVCTLKNPQQNTHCEACSTAKP
jgi:Sec-independent protein translocase protein TatA